MCNARRDGGEGALMIAPRKRGRWEERLLSAAPSLEQNGRRVYLLLRLLPSNAILNPGGRLPAAPGFVV